MGKNSDILTDSFGRQHDYLRISLIEKCNLRCSYCMPLEGVPLTPRAELMTADEIISISKTFVSHGVNKIRLTGGEPLIRKDLPQILEGLSKLPVKLSLTTNAVLVDRHIEALKKAELDHINVSLDSLNRETALQLTKRDSFDKAYQNILLLMAEGFTVKLNVVLIKGVNDNEVIDFIRFTEEHDIAIRFIEFMPFDGNQWDRKKVVTQEEILKLAYQEFGETAIIKLKEEKNFVSRDYKLQGTKGQFGIISTVSNPFCDGCNRIRLTANGRIKNCLFSESELDLLGAHRAGKSIEPIIAKALWKKRAVRAGMDTDEKFSDPKEYEKNRSMITIGG
jgi:molybdenum cofactor biosynthesis protein A